jgi:diadenylate cyclase
MSFIRYLISTITFKDAADILIVAAFLYTFFSLIRGTRAVQIIQGAGFLLLIMLASYLLKLEALYWLLRYSLITIAVAVPIVFQPELRRALGTIGRGSVFPVSMRPFGADSIARIADEISWTATILSQTKIGALIVIERDTGLQEFIETGVIVEGDISSKLLLSIFMKGSPLHDGAVILRENKVVAASCYLPLSENVPNVSKSELGTRHRAAIGITEQTDAVVVVVSEETGGISLCRNGKLKRSLNPETLKKLLISLYTRDTSSNKSLVSLGGADVVRLFKKKPGA